MRVLLADHHPSTLWALRSLVGKQEGFTVVGEATEATSLLTQAEALKPDLVLLDWDLPERPAGLIGRLHAIDPRPRVVAMSSRLETGRAALSAGADAFISKGDEPDWLLETLRLYAKRDTSGKSGS
jgi:DNA-binding NarL/FixJ family response regulator